MDKFGEAFVQQQTCNDSSDGSVETPIISSDRTINAKTVLVSVASALRARCKQQVDELTHGTVHHGSRPAQSGRDDLAFSGFSQVP
ncbi:hypothetical protein E2C01_016058 [Portunus trituberculatus]|uniref:Uncharacterized protein n=1 Tax=Portunus trituberculatus TaxID=210409 RepID=A0A5B7DPY0_PORTR|nr:hypothetical protein [Portunus trituberculatus]